MKGIEVWWKSSKSAVKWSKVNCSGVRWNGEVGNLNGWSLNGRKWSVEKCSERLSNRVTNIIGGYIDPRKFAAFMAFSFIIFLHVLLVHFFYHCVYGCMFCILLFNFVSYIYLLLCLYILIVNVCSVLYTLFSSCQLAFFGYPDWGFSVLFLSCKANARV